MKVVFEFISSDEKMPEHGQDIVILDETNSFGQVGFKPVYTEVEYTWVEYDNNGDETGTTCGYSTEDESQYKVGDRINEEGDHYLQLEVIVHKDTYQAGAKNRFFWMDVDSYYKDLDVVISK